MDHARCSGNNAFNLQIVVEAFLCTSADGRKNYVNGKNLIWTVQIENFSLDALTCQLALELNIGSNQLVSVWYFDKELGQNVRLMHDSQPSLMFEMYAAEMTVPLSVVVVDVIGSSGGNENVELVPIKFVAADDPLVMGTHNCQNNDQPALTTPTQPAPPHIADSVQSEVGSTSQPAPTTSQPNADEPEQPGDPSSPTRRSTLELMMNT